MFIELAQKGDNQWWRYLISLVVIIAVVLLAQIPLTAYILSGNQIPSGGNLADALDFRAMGLDRNIGLALMLLPFAAGLWAVLFSVKVIHNRSQISVINPMSAFRWHHFLMGFVIWFSVALLTELIGYISDPDAFEFRFDPAAFFMLLAVVLILIPLQSAFEEVLFRGWLMQGLGVLFRNKWAPVIISSCAFGLMHIANPEMAAFGTDLMLVNYSLFGLFIALVAVADEGLEIPIGIHAANNIFASIMVTSPSSALQTDALFLVEDAGKGWTTFGWIIPAVVLFLILKKKFNWDLMGSLRSYHRMSKPAFPWQETDSTNEGNQTDQP